ncbi:hypothetical protein KO516_11550 [Citreicella sp. C3M06]|uniref:hypothetical protein n=1 Tax=Citreicella sp. C3M06 TaxID=2841564 RepID=UPI001C082E69|nr:hypothetical protein [Citreicella sp. C3M06]MBU2961443.1 hypothetical protein [Citreicella sp. C3M06]
MTTPFLTSALAAVCLLMPTLAQADGTLDIAAQFEIQSPEPLIGGYIFTRMGMAETLVNASHEDDLTPGLVTSSEVS